MTFETSPPDSHVLVEPIGFCVRKLSSTVVSFAGLISSLEVSHERCVLSFRLGGRLAGLSFGLIL